MFDHRCIQSCRKTLFQLCWITHRLFILFIIFEHSKQKSQSVRTWCKDVLLHPVKVNACRTRIMKNLQQKTTKATNLGRK